MWITAITPFYCLITGNICTPKVYTAHCTANCQVGSLELMCFIILINSTELSVLWSCGPVYGSSRLLKGFDCEVANAQVNLIPRIKCSLLKPWLTIIFYNLQKMWHFLLFEMNVWSQVESGNFNIKTINMNEGTRNWLAALNALTCLLYLTLYIRNETKQNIYIPPICNNRLTIK